ncbi:MAG: YfhO family protein [Thermoanaerobaculia bacterium]
MAFLVFRLLAVYFGAAALFLWLAHRFVRPVGRRAGLLLALAPFLLAGRALVTGGVLGPIDIFYESFPFRALREGFGIGPAAQPILSDVALQNIPWQVAVRDTVAQGRPPRWNPYILSGEPLLAAQQHGILHPTTWVGLLLPDAQAWTFGMALRILLALLAAYLFFRELECGESASLFGAAAWAFSDYLVFHLGWQLQPAAAPFPLLLLGLRRLAHDPSGKAVGLTVVTLFLIISAGHPETVLHGVAGAGVLFLFQLWWAGRGRRWRPLLLSLVAGVLALGLTAVLLLPFREALPHTVEHAVRSQVYAKSDRSIPVGRSLERAVKNVMPYAFGVHGKSAEDPFFIGPAGYAGSILFPLAVLGLLSRRREKWPLLIAGGVGVATWARFPVVNDAVCRLPFFDIALNERLAFLTAFAVVALATFGVERLAHKEDRPPLLIAIVVCLVALATLFLHVHPGLTALGMRRRDQAFLFGLQLLPLVLLGLATWRRRRAVLAVPLALVLLLVQRWDEVGGLYPTLPAASYLPHIPLLDGIPKGEPFRVVALGWGFLPNVSIAYRLEDVRGYEAMTFAPLFETFPLWCVHQPVFFNRVDDPTRPFLSFLNVRWVIAPPGHPSPPGWRVAADDATGRLFENPNVLPRAFAPKGYFRESGRERVLEKLQSIADYRESGVVEEPGGDRVPNGEAVVQIRSYEPETLLLDVDAKTPTLVATSVTRWPGWKVFVDGSFVPVVPYNRAFFAFRVGAGRHRVRLAYEPDSVRAGLAVSLATLTLCLAFAFTSSVRRRAPLAFTLRRGPRAKEERAPPAPPPA